MILLSSCQDAHVEEQEYLKVDVVSYQRLVGGARILTGSIENSSDRDISAAQIQMSLYDPENRLVDSMLILVLDVEAGRSTAFREAVRSDFDIRSAKARSVFVP